MEATARPDDSGRGGEPTVARRRRMRMTRMPSEEEIEEFFAGMESKETKQFADKYNYDVAKDAPLEGRYEWIQMKP